MPEEKKQTQNKETSKQSKDANKKRKNRPGAWTSSNKKNRAMRKTRKRNGTLTGEMPTYVHHTKEGAIK